MNYVTSLGWVGTSDHQRNPSDSKYSALKTITSELPLEGKIAARACAKLAPKLLQQVVNVSLSYVYLTFLLT